MILLLNFMEAPDCVFVCLYVISAMKLFMRLL